MTILFEALWFILPAGCANMAPIFASHLLPKWGYPVDAGRTFRGKRIFGDHKTIRGLLAGIFVSSLVYGVQQLAYRESQFIREISLLDYGKYSLWFGAILGAGALGGDLLKSFFKRQVAIEPGTSWFPFDQIDWIIGTLLVAVPYVHFQVPFIVVALLLTLISSVVARVVGYWLNLNKTAL